MPYAEGKTLTGWGVIRNDPWDFAGIFPTREQAQAVATSRGPSYMVRYGDNQEGTDNFVWTNIDNPDADRT